VLLEGAASAEQVLAGIEDTLKKLDYSLQHLSPEMFKLTQQLFDVLGMGITRGPLTGIWGSWENASSEQIRNFLHRWENSYLTLEADIAIIGSGVGGGTTAEILSAADYKVLLIEEGPLKTSSDFKLLEDEA